MTEKRIDREAIRHLIAEEAAYWDTTDTSEMMGTEPMEKLEWTEREDRCHRCGGGMDTQRTDLHLAGERVILRDVPLYVCRTPGCGNTQLPPAIGELADRLETLVQETLAIQQTPSPKQSVPRHPAPPSWKALAVQRTPSPEPALVREDRTPYGKEEGKES